MATIVLVHGINNQRESADLIESSWLPALAGGIRVAGRGDLADRIWPQRTWADGISCRVAYYGDLFRSPDQQGGGADLRDLTPEQTALADVLALEWLERVADRAPVGSQDADQARLALEIARESERVQAQGRGNDWREAIKTLARVSWIANAGMSVAERFVPSLAQVSRYLTDESIRSKARKSVLDLIDADTSVIIGHSLGSVVAYECAHMLDQPLPLLVTLGSPLGLRTIVTERLIPPASFPPMAGVWLNVANREDIIAAEPDLCPLFGNGVPPGSRFEGNKFEECSEDPHRAETYLGRARLGREVIEVLN
ncbi:hypothetical protein EP7_000541 [Isosphaeraceae bacterium EP7]